MIFWASTNFVGMFGQLHKHIGSLEVAAQQTPQARGMAMGAALRKNMAVSVAGFAIQECGLLNLKISRQNAYSMKQKLERGHPYTVSEMLAELILLMQTIIQELSERKLAYIAPPYDIYFEQDKLFGEKVFDMFQEARADLKDAGNCLAASLPTASVYHLMRVAEYGLRKLAKRLRVTLTHSGKRMPLEFGDWHDAITGIKNKIGAARKLPRGARRQAKLEAYSGAADHCEYMKDIWRNNMAHTRTSYSSAEAVCILERVRDFMQFLTITLDKRAL